MGKFNLICPVVRAGEKAFMSIPFLSRLYMAPYRKVVQREIELAGLKAGERVLQVGAGSIPFSAIYLAQLGGVSVCAIDIDQQAIARARKKVQELNLAHRVRVELGNGKDFPLTGFTAAFIALQAAPKEEIISHIMNKGRGGMRVVVRQPRERLVSQYSRVSGNWPCQGKTRHKMVTFSCSLLFTKEKE